MNNISFCIHFFWFFFFFFLSLYFSFSSHSSFTVSCVYFHWAVFLPSVCVQCHKNKKPNPNKINATIFSNSDRCLMPQTSPQANQPLQSHSTRRRVWRKLAANRSHNSPVRQRCAAVDCSVMFCAQQWARWA